MPGPPVRCGGYQLIALTFAASAIMSCSTRADQTAESSLATSSGDASRSGAVATGAMSDSAAMRAQSALSASVPQMPSAIMSDSTLADFITMADRGEMEAGQLAVATTRNADVKAFGQSMIGAHRADLATVRRMAVGAGGKVQRGAGPNDATVQLAEMHTTTMAQLATATGDTFDRIYIDAIIRGHQVVLDALKHATLYRGASPITSHAIRLIPVVDEHLHRAMALQGKWEP